MTNIKNFIFSKVGIIIIASLIIIPILIILSLYYFTDIFKPTPLGKTNDTLTLSTEEPKTTTSILIDNLSHPWDLSFMDSDSFAYSQRGGEMRGFNTATKEDWLIIKPKDVYVQGEGGLLGLKVDVDFKSNKYIYTCMNVTGPSISVVRWKISDDHKTILERKDIITGMPSNVSGRHSGCRITMSQDGVLWVSTGDTADGPMAQNPKKLGGKVLRVDRDGQGIEGNMSNPFDPRIFSYGHRNVQGLSLFDKPIGDVYGYTVEQGSFQDDEVNLLKKGNFGWNPVPTYNETVPMTDLKKYPDAIPAIWSSGLPTIATSGMTIVHGSQWKAWDGVVMLGVLKDMHVRLQRFDSNYKLIRDDKVFTQFGRIRTIVESPDNNHLYLLTDNGSDQIIEVSLLSN